MKNKKLRQTLLVITAMCTANALYDDAHGNTSNKRLNHGYWGLSYSPAWHHIGNFTIEANDGSTAGRYPYKREGGTYIARNFDWEVQDPRIKFEDSKLWAIEASLGYRKEFARFEVEVGFEKFKTRATRIDEDNKVTEAIHLLAKDLAQGVVSGNTEKLGNALAKTSAQDIVAFAQAVGREAKDVDGKVCKKKVPWLGFYGSTPTEKQGDWSCVDYTKRGVSPNGHEETKLSSRFRDASGGDVKRDDIDSVGAGAKHNRGWPGTAEGKINTAQGMAGDLVSNLNREEKNAVAGILSKTISGAEVVEIRAVSTTSVMLNACYDFRQDDDNTFFPYGCVGVGTSLTSVADGHLSAKLAYKLKVGIDCEITPRMVVYAGGFYHKVLGDSEYYDIPTAHLVNDASPEGRSKNYAKAFFRMAYTGAEIGMRFSL